MRGMNEMPGWEPHMEITHAALEVVPEKDLWKEFLSILEDCSMLPDLCYPFMAAAQWRVLPEVINARPLKSFYADDYVLIRALPRRVGHAVPQVLEAIEPHFWRTLQAFRTETPLNACRQIGPLLHYIQDCGAPPHADPKCPHHIALEVFRRLDPKEVVRIPDYKPQLLGKTDQEALDGLRKRIAGLIEFAKQRVEPAVNAWPDREKVEPILLECALETARVCADFLHTMFTLALAPQPEGAGLEGTVTAAAFPFYNDLGARSVLVDTDYCTLAVSSSQPSENTTWQGAYRFHHLPPGTYRVLAYRTGSQMAISEPVTLEVGKVVKLDFRLTATEPMGNIVENPDARLCTLQPDKPDRWEKKVVNGRTIWTSTPAPVVAETLYRCGAVLKDRKARVSFVFLAKAELREEKGNYKWVWKADPVRLTLMQDQTHPREECYLATEPHTGGVVVEVETDKPSLTDAIERVWIVPASK